MLSTGNTSLGKRKGQSLVDILKRPFSRKSTTPPASPNCQLKQSKEDDAKMQEDDIVPQTEPPAAVELEDVAQPTIAENGTNSELFPLPLPPTPSPPQGTVCMKSPFELRYWIMKYE